MFTHVGQQNIVNIVLMQTVVALNSSLNRVAVNSLNTLITLLIAETVTKHIFQLKNGLKCKHRFNTLFVIQGLLQYCSRNTPFYLCYIA